MSRRRVIIVLPVMVTLGCTWAYDAYEDYNVRDMYALRVRLIPHDVAHSTSNWIAQKKLEATIAVLEAKLADAADRSRCTAAFRLCCGAGHRPADREF
jgi:hypothetical protein